MITTYEFAIRIALAALLGASIGIERQWRQKNAGLRTNTLVSLGSTAFILLSVSLGTSSDPSRVAAQIVSGIGFLGAGVIMKDGLSVQGLNTAATIWCSAAVGTLVGIGLFTEAIIVSMAVMVTHLLLRPVGLKLNRLQSLKSIHTPTDYLFTIKCKAEVENRLRVMLMQNLSNEETILLKSLTSDDGDDPSIAIITAEIKAITAQDNLIEKIASQLTIAEKVMKVSWEIMGTQTDS